MKLLETSYLVDYERGHDAARRFYEAHANESLAVSTISLFELAFGVVWSSPRDLDALVESLTWVEFLPFSVDDALEGARIQAELQSAGTRIPIADTMLAGVARNRGADLVASDLHFDEIDGLSICYHRE